MKTWVVRVLGPAVANVISAALVALSHRIVLDPRLAPNAGNLRIAVDAELHHETGDDAKEAGVIEEAVFDEVVETVGAVGAQSR